MRLRPGNLHKATRSAAPDTTKAGNARSALDVPRKTVRNRKSNRPNSTRCDNSQPGGGPIHAVSAPSGPGTTGITADCHPQAHWKWNVAGTRRCPVRHRTVPAPCSFFCWVSGDCSSVLSILGNHGHRAKVRQLARPVRPLTAAGHPCRHRLAGKPPGTHIASPCPLLPVHSVSRGRCADRLSPKECFPLLRRRRSSGSVACHGQASRPSVSFRVDRPVPAVLSTLGLGRRAPWHLGCINQRASGRCW